jgi:predicted N-acetyltransferase YhbS
MTALRKTPVALTPNAAPFAIRSERASDIVAREALLDASFGEDRHLRTCQRLRDGRAPAQGLALSAVRQGRLVGTLRLWHVSAGGVPALVLGPLAVETTCRKLGVGAALINHALAAARAGGHGAVILLGDAPYYARFGFSAQKAGRLSLPGRFDRDRLLGLELREGALDGAVGMIVPTGALERFQAKWGPVRVKKTHQINNLEPRFDSSETDRALVPKMKAVRGRKAPCAVPCAA